MSTDRHEFDRESDEAIALFYNGIDAPRITAKGSDTLAQAIIQLALETEVPVFENPELVSLLSNLKIGDEIPAALYQTIAEIIAFVYWLEGRENPKPSTHH